MNHLRTVSLFPAAGYRMFSAADAHARLSSLVCNRWTLLVCKLLIGVVSAYDIYLTIKYVEYLGDYELNPVGRWLMGLDNGPSCELKQVAGFITAKFVGNFLVLCVIELVASWRHHLATAVAAPVVVFQMWLLYFLLYGTH